MRTRHQWTAFPLLLLLLLTAGCTAELSPRSDGAAALRVSMIPTTDPTRAARENAVLASHLQRVTGRPVTVTVPMTYAAVVEALVHDQVDVAYLGGFTYVQAAARAGVVPLVQRERDRAFRSAIIASRATRIRTLADLKGHTFAFGDINSTSGHLMPAYFMRKAGVPTELFATAIYSGGHDATALAVASGKVAAGALDETILERLLQRGVINDTQVAVVYKTPPFFDYVWVARRAISPKVRQAVSRAFLDLQPGDPDQAKVLALLGASTYLPAHDSDYEALRQAAREQGLFQ
jgi:phosphonate transport system substrate-binding protein